MNSKGSSKGLNPEFNRDIKPNNVTKIPFVPNVITKCN